MSDMLLPLATPVALTAQPLFLDICSWAVPAGFPSPAADHTRKRIDLNEHLIGNKEATFLFRVKGDSLNLPSKLGSVEFSYWASICQYARRAQTPFGWKRLEVEAL